MVDALGGAPGVYTARYAGERRTYADNRAKLLAELAGVDRPRDGRVPDRGDRASGPTVASWRVEGVCAGVIATEERGDRGFGYDSVFVPDEGDGRTFAEMSRGREERASRTVGAPSAPCSASWSDGDDETPVIAAGDLEVADLRRHQVGRRERVVEPHERRATSVRRPRGREALAERDVGVHEPGVEHPTEVGMPVRGIEVADHHRRS